MAAADQTPQGRTRRRVGAASPARSLRRRVYEVIEIGRGEDRASRIFDATIVTLIVLNTAAIIAETVPSHSRSSTALGCMGFEVFAVVALRSSMSCGCGPLSKRRSCRGMPPWRARLAFAKSPALIIDLLAILPFYLHHFMPLDLGILRMLRLLRFLKLSRYSPAMHTLIRVLQNERKALDRCGAAAVDGAAVFINTHVPPRKRKRSPRNSARCRRPLGGRSQL